jgi:hypothetical protein
MRALPEDATIAGDAVRRPLASTQTQAIEVPASPKRSHRRVIVVRIGKARAASAEDAGHGRWIPDCPERRQWAPALDRRRGRAQQHPSPKRSGDASPRLPERSASHSSARRDARSEARRFFWGCPLSDIDFMATSDTGAVPASRRIFTIASSVNRLFFMASSSAPEAILSSFSWSENPRAGQSGFLTMARQTPRLTDRRSIRNSVGVVRARKLAPKVCTSLGFPGNLGPGSSLPGLPGQLRRHR